MKKVDVSNLIIGKTYYVEIKGSCWTRVKVKYIGIKSKRGKYPEYWFTFGSNIENWQKEFNLCATKSNLKIMEE